MTVTKQQQLEWLAKNADSFFGAYVVQMSGSEVGRYRMMSDSKYHTISHAEWQQERDKMNDKPEVDDSWFTYCKLPPCGIPIELWFGGSFAYNCEFIAMRGNTYVVWNLDADKPDCADSLNSEFRPLRTEWEKMLNQQDNSWHERGEFPPVGCECEVFVNDKNKWMHFEVIAIRDGHVLGWCREVSCGFQSNEKSEFRPLCTEREKAIDELNAIVGDIEKYPTWRDAIAGIIDAGYRKVNP